MTIVAQTLSPNVEAYVVAKGQHFQQTGPGPSALASNLVPFRFSAFVTPAFPGAVSNVSLRTPTGKVKVLTNDSDRFVFEQGFASRNLLDNSFTNGIYTFTIRTLSEGVRVPSLALSRASYPGTPHIANWEAAQDIDATADFMLVWDPFVGGTSNDFIHIEIEEATGDGWGSPGFLDEGALDGTATSFAIPANTLAANQAYQARLLFVKRIGLNLTSYPRATGVSGYYRETSFELITSPPAPPQGRLQFSASVYEVIETGGMATIIVTRTGGSQGDVSVNFATSNGTATDGTDYDGNFGTLQFADGQTAQTFQVAVHDDFQLEGNETIHLSLNAPGGGAILASPGNAVLRILDNELPGAGVLQFSATNYVVNETSRVAVLTVSRSGGAAGTVTVQYSCSDVSANAGLDYTNVAGTLSFAPQQTSRTIVVPIINDTIDEDAEAFFVNLNNPTGGAALGLRQAARVITGDNDSGGVINFRFAAYRTNENSPQALVAVTRTGGAASGVTINFETTDGTATADTHYLATNGTLTFGANQTVKTFAVPIINNTLDEPNRTVLLHLSEPTGGATLGSLSDAVLTILDDDSGGVISFRTNLFKVSEAAGTATITVVRTGRASDVTVDYTTSDGTATDGEDYFGTSGTLTFEAGQLSQTFTIDVLDDGEDEPNKTVLLHLSNLTGGATLGAPANSVLRIVDDEVPVEGLYKISGSVTDSGCTDQPDGTMSFQGELLLYDQFGNEFQGTGLLVSTTRGGAVDLSLSGTVDASGRISADYISDSGGAYGTMTGTISGKNLQVSFSGREEFDTCRHHGTLSGSIYAPGSAGLAPGFLGGLTVVARVTGGSGAYGRSGVFQIDFSEFDHGYESYALQGNEDLDSGVYLYTKTGANTASLLTYNQYDDVTTSTAITFTTATTGTYSSTGIGVVGTQTGTFRITDPFEE